ncbi:MAG TPA: TonB family protein [Bryobacteraceae bacterium]|nr:TonB family protein [Bryobacteraceae bacterium]
MANERQRRPQRWEGSIVDGVFRLDQCLGEGESGVVFRTGFSRRQATIKLIPADGAEADAQLASWNAAARLNHPNLARILASERSSVNGAPVVYLVTEYADETMADVLAERFLTPTEARDVLASALDALAYLHSQGLAHGHIKASNFLAIGDQLKLSVDGIAASGPGLSGPSEDVRMLGALFQDVLDKPLPQPFLDITSHALDPDPRTRWTVPEIATRLDGRMPVRAAEHKPPVWRWVLPAAAIVIVATLFLIARSARPVSPARAPAPAPAVAQSAPPAVIKTPALSETKAETKPEPVGPAPRSSKRRPDAEPRPATNSAEILNQPMPDVPAKAIRTIHGKVIIPIRVNVDPSGNVTDAKLDSRTGSRYLAGYALGAARQWKFTPSGAPESWVLRFTFTRENTTVSSQRLVP